MGIFKKKTDKKQSASTRFVLLPCSILFSMARRYECNYSSYSSVTNRASIGRWVDNSSKGLQASVGKYKAGVQRLSKADLRKITSTKKR